MHIALTMPTKKTLIEQAWPALIAVALIAFGAFFIPISFPVTVSEGRIHPDTASSGQTVEVQWRQDWRKLCPLTVTREFVGHDGFKKTTAKIEHEPASVVGVKSYRGRVVIPSGLPPGPATYHAVIEPHCWVDVIWQRSYRTPDVHLTIVSSAK